MSLSLESPKTEFHNADNGGIPAGLEWLAAIAEDDLEQRREKIVQDVLENHRRQKNAYQCR